MASAKVWITRTSKPSTIQRGSIWLRRSAHRFDIDQFKGEIEQQARNRRLDDNGKRLAHDVVLNPAKARFAHAARLPFCREVKKAAVIGTIGARIGRIDGGA